MITQLVSFWHFHPYGFETDNLTVLNLNIAGFSTFTNDPIQVTWAEYIKPNIFSLYWVLIIWIWKQPLGLVPTVVSLLG